MTQPAIERRPDPGSRPDSILADLRCWWTLQPNKVLFFVLFVPWLLLFHFLGNATFAYIDTHSLFRWMHYVFTTSPDDDYCLLIPLVVAALFVWKRKVLMAIPKQAWWPGLLLVTAGLLIHILGFMVQQARVSIAGFFIGLYGMMGAAWGREWLKATFFPMFLFIFCIPLGTIGESITLPLRRLVTGISVGIGHEILGIEVFQDGSQILGVNGRPLYDVAPACSGIRSLVSLLALTVIYGFMSFNTVWKRLILIVAAVPFAIISNVTRISIVIIVGEVFGHTTATWIEQKLGFITFAMAILGTALLSHWLREERSDQVPAPAVPSLA